MASVLLRMEADEREALRAAARKAGQKMAPWAVGVLLHAAGGGAGDPVSPRSVASEALRQGETRAAHLGVPAIAVRCSLHKRVRCPRCP